MSSPTLITYRALGPSVPFSTIGESSVGSIGIPINVVVLNALGLSVNAYVIVDAGIAQERVQIIDLIPSVPAFGAIFANLHTPPFPVVLVVPSGNNDAQWGQGQSDFLSNLEATAQAVLTRLRLFTGEWWASTTDGLPMFQSILGGSAAPANLQQIELLISARILGTPYVISLSNVQVIYTPSTRGPFRYSATVNTQFGQFVVNNFPTPQSGALS